MKFAACLLILSALPACAADAKFELASVKPNLTHAPGSMRRVDGRRVQFENDSLRSFIRMAYNIRDTQLAGGPAWAAADRWDLEARPASALPKSPESEEILRGMMRTLLAERFQLVVHREMREQPIYALAVAKGGPKLKPSGPDSLDQSSRGPALLKASRISMERLARTFTDILDRTVVDQTGLGGLYDLELKFAPLEARAAAESELPSIFTVVQQDLGLKLESRKAPVEVIVIDSAEKADEN